MRLAVQEQLLPGDTLQAKWDAALAWGFDAIELRGGGGHALRDRLPDLRAAQRDGVVMPTVCVDMDHFIGDFDPGRRADAIANMATQLAVVAELRGVGAMTPASWGMFSRRLPPFTPPRSAEADREVLLDALGRLGEVAAREGVLLLLEPLNRYEDHMVNTVAQAAELGDHAAREGAVLALEPLNRYEDHMVNRLEQAVELVTTVGRPSVRVLADTYHMNIEEDEPTSALVGAAGWLGHVQVSDSNRFQPGAGHIDWAALLGTLDAVGYDGYLALECRLRGEPSAAVAAVPGFLRRHDVSVPA